VAEDKLNRVREILHRGNEVNQMMKVIGEEGTNINDFMIYQKSEFVDYVYLQQNTFDDVDAATSSERQIYVFDKVMSIMDADFNMESKEDARRFIQELRQLFIDWNYVDMKSDEFSELEKRIDDKIAASVKKV